MVHGAATAVEVMSFVEASRKKHGLSKAELSRRGRVLPETVRHLLSSPLANPTLSSTLAMLRPLGLGLAVAPLFHQVDDDKSARLESLQLKSLRLESLRLESLRLESLRLESLRLESLRLESWLAHYGASLYGEDLDPVDVPPPEVVLADAMSLARKSATVARALPPAFWKCRHRLDFDLLLDEGRRRGRARELGFFLDLVGQLSGDSTFETAASQLKVRSLHRPQQFFRPTTARERKLAELTTPEPARKWGFRMNMDMDCFKSMFEKGHWPETR